MQPIYSLQYVTNDEAKKEFTKLGNSFHALFNKHFKLRYNDSLSSINIRHPYKDRDYFRNNGVNLDNHTYLLKISLKYQISASKLGNLVTIDTYCKTKAELQTWLFALYYSVNQSHYQNLIKLKSSMFVKEHLKLIHSVNEYVQKRLGDSIYWNKHMKLVVPFND